MKRRGAALLGALVLTMGCSDSSGTAPDAQGSGGSGGEGTMSTGGGANPASGGGSGGSGPSGSGGTALTGTRIELSPDNTGWVDGSTNNLGIQGAWYSYNDCADSPGDCTTGHLPEEGSFPNAGGKMCTQGTTAAVASEEEFSTKWGAGIALDLNHPGGDGERSTYDATARGIVGLAFTITGTAPGLRVNLVSASASDSHFAPATTGEQTVAFADVQQGSWVANEVDLDASALEAVQFQIPSAMNETVAFDFCVEHFAVVR